MNISNNYNSNNINNRNNQGFSDNKELSRSEFDCKDSYFGASDPNDYAGRSKRLSISSAYEDDFEEEDSDDRGGLDRMGDNMKMKNRFK